MCQREVLLVLSLERKWLTSNEISDKIPYFGYCAISRALRKMAEYKEIDVRPKENTKHQFEYKTK